MRGNLNGCEFFPDTLGSIPALAGEPFSAARTEMVQRVYPRACGGTLPEAITALQAQGLSPRLRGNRNLRGSEPLCKRSIPALAGEPISNRKGWKEREVYPRACGGTTNTRTGAYRPCGLSPRLRGNPVAAYQNRCLCGSIPALAGEPKLKTLAANPIPVYPRACGGTRTYGRGISGGAGLSPRLRGNQNHAYLPIDIARSIPALAGEPASRVVGGSKSRVYPRACGGTWSAIVLGMPSGGLSPRLRGNPPAGMPTLLHGRSIPALAGEPRTAAVLTWSSMVYPRACGGTTAALNFANAANGLSPRLRGNPAAITKFGQSIGSIPALAGEPS